LPRTTDDRVTDGRNAVVSKWPLGEVANDCVVALQFADYRFRCMTGLEKRDRWEWVDFCRSIHIKPTIANGRFATTSDCWFETRIAGRFTGMLRITSAFIIYPFYPQ